MNEEIVIKDPEIDPVAAEVMQYDFRSEEEQRYIKRLVLDFEKHLLEYNQKPKDVNGLANTMYGMLIGRRIHNSAAFLKKRIERWEEYTEQHGEEHVRDLIERASKAAKNYMDEEHRRGFFEIVVPWSVGTISMLVLLGNGFERFGDKIPDKLKTDTINAALNEVIKIDTPHWRGLAPETS